MRVTPGVGRTRSGGYMVDRSRAGGAGDRGTCRPGRRSTPGHRSPRPCGGGCRTRPLPRPVAGAPSRVNVPGAAIDVGFVPTVGPAFAHNALSAVTAEAAAQHDLHGVPHMTMGQMGDLGIFLDLDRSQIELVAARTSLLNDCFF